MTQPDRPDRAAAEQRGQDRVAAQLRHAARSYEPDGDRIRKLIDARAAATGGAPIKTREPRGLGGRAVMWPVVGSAAAAAVILAVAASGAPSGPEVGGGAVTVGTSPTDGVASSGSALSSSAPSVSPSGTLLPPTSTSSVSTSPGRPASSSAAHGARGGTTATVPGPAGSAAPGRAASPGTSAAGGSSAAGGAAGSAPAAPLPGGTSTTGTITGGRVVTAVVQPVGAGGLDVSLGRSGETWVLASSATPSAQLLSVGNGTALGPVQPVGGGAAVEPGPFRVSWQNGVSTATGSTSNWLTMPPQSSSAAPLLRIPVRFKVDNPTVVLYVGTFGGGGKLLIGTTGNSPLSVPLPGCPGVCSSVVTITSHGGAGVPNTGDLPVDVLATTATKVAVAAATLG